jgi:SagB-type dehydrogenase family enzyme
MGTVNAFATARNLFGSAILIAAVALPAMCRAGELAPRPLPAPRMEGGMPLMEALRERQSKRDFTAAPLPPQVLSDLLWAAFGINRPADDHRTAPSGMNAQEIDVYLALAEGVYVYDAKAHRLNPIANGDARAKTGGQDFVKVAPVALVFVADLSRMVKAKPEVKEVYAWNGAGYISQNVYLYCASAGLATVVHEVGNRGPLAEALKLRPEQKIILAQAVGYPGPAREKSKRE